MAFYYVKAGGMAGGTNNGRETVLRTGTWNADTSTYYATVLEAINAPNSPAQDDYILWSTASVDAINATTQWNLPDGVSLFTVDDTDQASYLRAPSAQMDQVQTYYFSLRTGSATSVPAAIQQGLFYVTGNGYGRSGSPMGPESLSFLHDMTFQTNSSSSEPYEWGDLSGGIAWFHNLNFNALVNTDQTIITGFGNVLNFVGGAVTNNSDLCEVGERYGLIRFTGVDMSAMVAGANLATMDSANGGGYVEFYRCPLPANWTVTNLNVGAQYGVIVESCDSEFQYEVHCQQGEVNFVTSRYHDDDVFLSDGLSKGSYGFLPNTEVSYTNPLLMMHPISPRWIVAENTTPALNPNVRIKFASDATLTTKTLWVYVCYPDAANPTAWKSVRHQLAPFELGAALATESGKWVGANTTNQYTLDIICPTPGIGLYAVMVGVTEDVDVYVSPQLEFVP